MIPIVISSTGVIPMSLSQSLTRLNLHPNTYIQLQKSVNSWHMFKCKILFKLQIRPPSLILFITTSQDRWIYHSQSWEVKNSIIIIIYCYYLMRRATKIVLSKIQFYFLWSVIIVIKLSRVGCMEHVARIWEIRSTWKISSGNLKLRDREGGGGRIQAYVKGY